MCLTPVMIDNPNYHSPIRAPTYHLLHNTVDSKIPVPCGRCASCVHLKQVYLIQRVQMEALNNDLFYGTLTYNEDSLPIANYNDISFAYPDFTDWQKMIKMIRKDYPDLKFKYMLVSEYGGKKHRPHFHFILSLPRTDKNLSFKIGKAYDLFHIFLKYWRRNLGSTRFPIWKPLCTYVRKGNKYNFDLHYLDPNSSVDGLDGVAFYVTKYILKFDDWVDKFKSKLFFNLDLKEYKEAWSKFRPRILLSKFFGSPNDPDVRSHIINGINFSLDCPEAFFPFYISKQNGSTYPLSPYYSKRFLDESSQLVFCSRRPDILLTEDDVIDFDKRQSKLSDIRSFLSKQITDFDYDISDINYNISFYANDFRTSEQVEEFTDSWEDY